MGRFKEWFASQLESNARKRAVRAALLGIGPDLPGSYAACPSTIPAAMDTADETGVVTKWKKHKKHKKEKDESVKLEGKSKSPDYTIDRALDAADKMKDTVRRDIDDLHKKEAQLEKRREKESKEIEKGYEQKRKQDDKKAKDAAKDAAKERKAWEKKTTEK